MTSTLRTSALLYDKFVNAHNNIPAQTMLMPLYIDVTAHDTEIIEKHREDFRASAWI